jgi:hypothetical protein
MRWSINPSSPPCLVEFAVFTTLGLKNTKTQTDLASYVPCQAEYLSLRFGLGDRQSLSKVPTLRQVFAASSQIVLVQVSANPQHLSTLLVVGHLYRRAAAGEGLRQLLRLRFGGLVQAQSLIGVLV